MDILYCLNWMINNKYTISFAESCTGGLACAERVKRPNASWVLNESYVVYATKSKVDLLGVDEKVIDEFGVVSEEVAHHMAVCARIKAHSDIGIGITGNGGPTGCLGNNPIGAVCFGISLQNKDFTYKVVFENKKREEVINASVAFVYEKLREVLENENL